MDWKLEVVVMPVADVDRAKAFYERVGFVVDTDHQAGEDFRVVQLTPPGSACSIVVGRGIPQSEPGTTQGLHLVVPDIEVAHKELLDRGIEASEPFHFGAAGQVTGLHPERADYGTFLTFSDPDGNGWLVQEIRSRASGR